MANVGYIWVGPLEHNAEFQRDLLRQRGVGRIFEDISANSSTPTRPELTSALDSIREGDTMVIWRLDRLASSTSNVLSLLELLGRRGVGVTSITEGLDTLGAEATPVLDIIAMVNELERQLVRERTMVGVYAARARGRVAGRPRALSATNVDRVLVLREQGATVREIAQELGTSRATIYRAIEASSAEDDEESAPAASPTSAHSLLRSSALDPRDGLALGNN
jgi:DNA invertase Pin-like site-specific DNA recombinase